MNINEFIPELRISESNNFFLIAGPCVVEGREIVLSTAERIVAIAENLDIPLVFKASYRKANRSRLDSFRGIGDVKALNILSEVNKFFNVPVLTDIHSADEVKMAAKHADVLQIPAFLCRQTDILLAAGETGKTISIKKGQFLSPSSMKFAVEKIRSTGNNKVLLTDRGTMLGYQDLVVDYRGIPEMQAFGVPVVLDVTHSLQAPNQEAGVTGGRPDMIETIARAGIAVGVDGIFLETHPDPASALSDGENMLHLDHLEGLLKKLILLRKTILSF
ncbi:3-deoxy-8-phosphooctulonate synthase [Bacteroidota bacterium]